jgi:PAS domain S-box-containing protein
MKSCRQSDESASHPGLEGGPAAREAVLEMPREELESQLEERNQELAQALCLLQASLESTKDGILALDTSGKVLSINSKFAAIWKFPADVLERRDHAELVAYAARQVKNPEQFLARAHESRFAPESEVFDTIELKDGRIFERRAIPQRVDNRCVGAVVNWHEVTRRKRAERELRDSQALYHSLVDQMPCGVFRKDAQGRYVFVNATFCWITGMSADQILGKTATELYVLMKAAQGKECRVSDEIGRRGESHHELIMRTGREIEAEDVYADPSGKPRYYQVYKSPVFGFGGEVIGSQGLLLDITERKRAEGELAQERDLLRVLLQYCPDSIFFKDLQSRLVRASRSEAANLLKVALSRHGTAHPTETGDKLPPHLSSLDRFQEYVIGKTDSDFYGPERAAAFRQAEQGIIRTGVSVVGNVEKTICPDGKVIWFMTTKAPWRNNDGEIIGTFGISTDITKLKEAEAKLDAERALLGSLLDHSPDHIYFKDLQSRFIKTSQKHAEQFGLKNPDEVVGRTDFDFFDKTHAGPAFEEEQEIIRTGAPLIGKVQKKITKDGRVTWALVTKMPLRDKTGQIIGTFGVSKDITAMKEAEAKLEQLHRQLLETSRQAGMAEVATGVLHNVGNVLNSVNVAASLLSERLRKSKISTVGRVAAMLQEHENDLGEFVTRDPKGRLLPSFLGQLGAHLAAEQVSFLEELTGLEKNIDHIKDIVAMQQSYAKVSGVTQTVGVLELVEDALSMNDRALLRHDVKLVREYDPAAPQITVDKHKVMQILINLVRNAKYACDDTAAGEKRMVVRVARAGDRVRISVIDNGVGIPPENLTRVFNHGFTTRKNGHGFGLHSGALAAREMGGSLEAHSDGIGRGATFTLELPLQPPAAA